LKKTKEEIADIKCAYARRIGKKSTNPRPLYVKVSGKHHMIMQITWKVEKVGEGVQWPNSVRERRKMLTYINLSIPY
jgi:hypothetical protein